MDIETTKLPDKDSTRKDLSDPAAYFRSPITSLTRSLQDGLQGIMSLQDVIQAYGVLSMRVKALPEVFSNKKKTAALKSLEENTSTVAKCLARDIGRAASSYLEEIDYPYGKQDVSLVLNEEDLNEGREYATLAQQALLLLVEMLSPPDPILIFEGICKFITPCSSYNSQVFGDR